MRLYSVGCLCEICVFDTHTHTRTHARTHARARIFKYYLLTYTLGGSTSLYCPVLFSTVNMTWIPPKNIYLYSLVPTDLEGAEPAPPLPLGLRNDSVTHGIYS